MDIPLPGEVIPFPSSPSRISKSPPPMPPLTPDFDHIPLPPTVGKQNQSPPSVNNLSKAPPLPLVAPPLPPTSGKTSAGVSPTQALPKGVPSVESKGNGETILWSSIPPPPAPAPPPEDSRYSPSHATPADEENERVLFPASLTLPPPPPPSDHGHNSSSSRSPPKPPVNPPLPPNRPPVHPSHPDPPLPAPPPKTAVLGKMQAKKRLLAFSMTKQGGGLGLSFGFAKSTRVVNKASANAFVGSGEDEEASEKKEVVNKTRKKKKEEREVLAIEEIKREEERLKEALGIRQQTHRTEPWAEEMWGISPPVHEMILPTLGATTTSGEERDANTVGETATIAAVDASVPSENTEGGGVPVGDNNNNESEPNISADVGIADTSNNAERGDSSKGKSDGSEGKEDKKEGSERKDKKGERSSRKKEKESGSRRREEEGGDKERSKRDRGSGGRSGRERRSDRKRESRRSNDGPPSGWKQLKEAGGEWNRERSSHRPSNREERGRERSSRSHRSRSRDHKRSGHSGHRSRSRSADVHRRPQASPFFVAKGAKHGEKEFPLRLLRHTRTRPPLSYCENPETAAPPRPTTRREAFASEPPDVVCLMRMVTEASFEKEIEGKDHVREASGLAALRVSYEGGDEDEGEDEQKRSDRPWFAEVSSFLSESETMVMVQRENAVSVEDGVSVKDKEGESKNDFEFVPEDADIGKPNEGSKERPERLNAEEENSKDATKLLKESESMVHSKWDSDADSRGIAAVVDKEDKNQSPSETKEMEVEANLEDERKEIEDEDEGDMFVVKDDASVSDENDISDNTAEESEIEEKKDQQLASEYEEFMKAVSAGGEDDEDEDDDGGVWDSSNNREERETCEMSDHRDSDSSEPDSAQGKDHTGANSSDLELGSDVPSNEEAPSDVEIGSDIPSDEERRHKIAKQSSSDSENDIDTITKDRSGSDDEKEVNFKEKVLKKKERSRRDDSDSDGESDGEIHVPRKKRKLSSKKTSGTEEVGKRKSSEERKKKLKVKEKTPKKKKEKEKKRKKKKERRKKRSHRRGDSSEMESDSDEVSDDCKTTGSTKVGQLKSSESKKRARRNDQSSEEVTSDNSSDSSEVEERRRSRKKKRKKRKKHGKPDSRREKDEILSEEEDQSKKGKLYVSKKKRGKEGKNKRRGSDDSECSDEINERFSGGEEKSKPLGEASVNGKENGIEEEGGKRGKKQRVKERGRKKKRKGSPLSTKKHGSSRRRSPSTSDGSPTPGRGSHSRENAVNKVQGNRGRINDSGQSSVDSNSSGNGKKPGDTVIEDHQQMESVHHWENSKVEGSRFHHRLSRTGIQKKSRELDESISASSSVSLSVGRNSGILKDKELQHSALNMKKNRQDVVTKRMIAECAMSFSSPSSSSSSPSSMSLSSVSSSSSTDSSSTLSSESDSRSDSSLTSSPSYSSASSSDSSLSSSSSYDSSSSDSSFVCSPSSAKAEPILFEEPESHTLIKEDRMPITGHRSSPRSPTLRETPEHSLDDYSFSSPPEEFQLHKQNTDRVCSPALNLNRTQSGTNFKSSLKEDNISINKCIKEEFSSIDTSFSCINSAADVGHHQPRQVCETVKPRDSDEPENKILRRHESGDQDTFSFSSKSEQSEDYSLFKNSRKSKSGYRESNLSSMVDELCSFKTNSDGDQLEVKSVTATEQKNTSLPFSRPSRWDTRPGISGANSAASTGTRGTAQDWEMSPSVPGLPVLPVPFPTCPNKPLDEIPLPILGVPQPVASPWGSEGTPNKCAIPIFSSDISVNPIRGLADSTISDSELAGRCVSVGALGGQPQGISSPTHSDRQAVVSNRTISSQSDQKVESFPVVNDSFVETVDKSVNVHQKSGQQFHSADNKIVEQNVGTFPVGEHYIGRNAESAASSFPDVSKDADHAVAQISDTTPTDWDDPEAFVGSGLSSIKSHVIQVGNFLQVVPSEQPIISHPYTNSAAPVPAAVPPAAVSSGVPPIPVPPAPNMSTVMPVAPPISSAPVAFPSPVVPVSSFQPIMTSSHSNLPSSMSAPSTVASLSVDPVSPSLTTVSTTSPSSNATPLAPSVASLIPALSTVVPSMPSPTSSLSQIPLLASLAPGASSCPNISQIPLDPAALLGTLISHALALGKKDHLHSPSCSPLVMVQPEDAPPTEMAAPERETRKIEKRKKSSKGSHQATHLSETLPTEDDVMPSTEPMTKAIQDDFVLDPEEVALIQEAMSKVPGEEEDFEEENNKITRVKEKRKKPRASITVFPPATRGILIPPGIREKPSVFTGGVARGLNSGTQGQRKSVMFADGVRPGDGTSPSAGEDLPSPPPPMRKAPKEKRLRKKKKIKVKIIRQIRMESAEEDDDDDDDASPPPPPPGSPPPSLLLHQLSSQHSPRGCEGAIPNPASHYPYPSAPTMPPTHSFTTVQAQQQLPPTPNTTHVTAGGSATLPPNALPPRIPQWAPCT